MVAYFISLISLYEILFIRQKASDAYDKLTIFMFYYFSHKCSNAIGTNVMHTQYVLVESYRGDSIASFEIPIPTCN